MIPPAKIADKSTEDRETGKEGRKGAADRKIGERLLSKGKTMRSQ